MTRWVGGEVEIGGLQLFAVFFEALAPELVLSFSAAAAIGPLLSCELGRLPISYYAEMDSRSYSVPFGANGEQRGKLCRREAVGCGGEVRQESFDPMVCIDICWTGELIVSVFCKSGSDLVISLKSIIMLFIQDGMKCCRDSD